jgi:hypothetical protein
MSPGSTKAKGWYTKPLRRLSAGRKVRFLNIIVVIRAKLLRSIV